MKDLSDYISFIAIPKSHKKYEKYIFCTFTESLTITKILMLLQIGISKIV